MATFTKTELEVLEALYETPMSIELLQDQVSVASRNAVYSLINRSMIETVGDVYSKNAIVYYRLSNPGIAYYRYHILGITEDSYTPESQEEKALQRLIDYFNKNESN